MVDEDLEIFGATVGDISHIVVYADVTTGRLYDSNGNLYGNTILSSFLDNDFTLELHYVEDISTSNNPTEWKVWDGLTDYTVSSTLSFDKDYVHAFSGEVVSNVASGESTIDLTLSNTSKSTTFNNTGTIIINPYGSGADKFSVEYTSYSYVSGTTFRFNITGLTRNIAASTPVRVSDALYIYLNPNEIYEANIPDRYSEGVFNFPIHVMSHKLLSELDSTGVSQVGGTMEHKIYVDKNNLTGVTISGNTYTRNKEADNIATATNETVPRLYCAWKHNSTNYWTKGNTIEASTPVYTVSSGVATLQNVTASPVYSVVPVLFRTFTFPFIVKNLIDYGTSFTIPVENVDWFKTYIFSIIDEYMARH